MEEYKITYGNLMGSVNPNPSSYTKSDLPIVLKNLSKENYKFVGWLSEDEEIITSILEDSCSDRYLYALWEKIDNITLKYDENTLDTVFNMPDNIIIKKGDSITISEKTPTRNGFNFVSWNTKKDNTGITLNSGDRIENINEDTILYAKWNPSSAPTFRVNITFDKNASGDNVLNMPSTISVEPGRNVKIPSNIPVRNGYAFISWNTKKDNTGTKIYPNELLEEVTENLTLYAIYVKINVNINSFTNDYKCICCGCRCKLEDICPCTCKNRLN